jgi:asparagine synthase (glutamine-hydrolysing)
MRWVYGYEGLFRSYSSDEKPMIEKRESVRNRSALNRYLIRQHDLGLENLLFYGDIVAMRHSVENRSPFLDHRLVDFAFSRSERLKVWNGTDKYVLRALPVYARFREQLERAKVGFSSNMKIQTKLALVEELRASTIFAWPIFSGGMAELVGGAKILSPKYERLFFRLYQVHLWNEIFQAERP